MYISAKYIFFMNKSLPSLDWLVQNHGQGTHNDVKLFCWYYIHSKAPQIAHNFFGRYAQSAITTLRRIWKKNSHHTPLSMVSAMQLFTLSSSKVSQAKNRININLSSLIPLGLSFLDLHLSLCAFMSIWPHQLLCVHSLHSWLVS